MYQIGNFPATDEQARAIDLALTGQSLKIEAGAGTGKSSTLTAIAHYTGKQGVYIAYNRSVVVSARKVFPASIECVTAHGMAYRAFGCQFKERLEDRPTAPMIAEWLSRDDDPMGLSSNGWAYLVLETLQSFTCTADASIGQRHINQSALDPLPPGMRPAVAAAVAKDARKVWVDMTDPHGQLPVSHDVYLKEWATSSPTLDYDLILYDEAQDANPVMVAAVNSQKAQQIWVGDRYQNIYRWRGALNAMAEVATDHETQITQSFRFGPAIADIANQVLEKWLQADMRIRGFDKVDSKVSLQPVANPTVVLCRTNMTAMQVFMEAIDANKSPIIVGGVNDLLRLLYGAGSLMAKKQPSTPSLIAFKSWKELVEYAESPVGADLRVLVSLVRHYGVAKLIGALKTVKGRRNGDLTICTAHKSKGLEWPIVALADDFRFPGDGKDWCTDEANLLYVAVTRATKVLDISRCPAVHNLLGIEMDSQDGDSQKGDKN